METTILVGAEGTLTLPPEFVARNRIEPGDSLRLLDLGGVFVVAAAGPSITDLAREIEDALKESGLTMEEMFAGLRTERSRYVAEQYGADGA